MFSVIAALWRSRRAPAVLAVGLVVLGAIGTAARLDSASDGSVLRLGGSTWHANGVVVDVVGTLPSAELSHAGLQAGDLVTGIVSDGNAQVNALVRC